MTRRVRAWPALLPLAGVLAACAPAGEEPRPPVPTFTPTPAASSGMPSGRDLDAWAAEALPSDRAGGASAVVRMTGTLDTLPAAAVDISQEPGLWDLLIACRSVDASPITYELVSPTAVFGEPSELTCTSPDGGGTPSTAVVAFDGTQAALQLSATAEAVFVLEVRRHESPAD
jgi:hypothetical protein